MERSNPRTGSGAVSNKKMRSGGKRRTKFSRTLAISKLIFAGLVLALIIILIIFITDKPTQGDLTAIKDGSTFIEGISVNGVDLSGMTYDQAYGAVLPSVETDMKRINITVYHGTMFWLFTAADMKVASTLNDVLGEAILLGHNGTVIANNKEKEDIESNGKSFTVTFTPDETALRTRLAVIASMINTEPVEPYASTVSTSDQPEFTYHQGTEGYVLDENAVYDEIAGMLAAGNYTGSLEPALNFAEPTETLDDLKANVQLISTFQTSFGGSRAARNEKRVGNIQRACTLLNGMIVKDQEEFNFNAYIGPRTEADGWPLAPGIVNGNSYEDEAGGGICQVSTTLYNALLCTGASMQRGSTLEEVLAQGIEGISITERKHHSWPSSYADTGLDCTVTGTVDSGKSLSFVNNTGATLYFFVYCDQENYTCTVFIYGKPLPDGITYKVRGVEDEILPASIEITYDETKPADYSEDLIKARDGIIATAWRDTYLNGELQSSEALYQDTYQAVTGERVIGTGGAPAPSSTIIPKD